MTTRSAAGGLALDADTRALLAGRIDTALGRARHERRTLLASVTTPVSPDLDLSAAVMRARRPQDRFFCLEQPDRHRFALATLGCVALVEESGPRRFTAGAERCRALADGAVTGDAAEDPGAPPASGPVWVGGFAFAGVGGATPEWSPLAPLQMVMPEVSLVRLGDAARMTVTVAVDAGSEPAALLAAIDRRLSSVVAGEMPLLDPDPVVSPRVGGAAPPEHYEGAVARAVEQIAAGELEKIVLAREVRVHAGAPIDPAPVLGGLRSAFPACYSYCVGAPGLAFVGASPELLVRREGARAQSVALAGTTRRSADPAIDRHLGEQLLQSEKNREEQRIVARRIERTLAPRSVWVTAAEEPVLVRVQNVQHLGTPIRAQLAEAVPSLELAGLLHPTPAVGGEPSERALPLIPALEGLDRGWYAGGVGWSDLGEDGEFCVALRCALLRERVAHLYAGCGIVRDSVPSEELAETEVKLQALLPLLT